MEKVNTTERLKQLRELMRKENVDIYSEEFRDLLSSPFNKVIVVPSEDSHQSEYIAPCDARRGSATKTTLSMSGHKLIHTSIHMRLHRLSRHGSNYAREGIISNRRAVFQSGRKTTRRELGAAQAGSARRPNMARMVCDVCAKDVGVSLSKLGQQINRTEAKL